MSYTWQGNLVKTPEEVMDASYGSGKTDEFIEPSLIMGVDGVPISLVKENDSVVFYNFRIDRPRQLTRDLFLTILQKQILSGGLILMQLSTQKHI